MAVFRDPGGVDKVGFDPAQVLAVSKLGVCVLSADGSLLGANDAICQLLGRTSEELQGRQLQEFLDVEGDRQQVRCRRPDGSVVCVDVYVSRVPDDSGCAVVQAVDITDQENLRERDAYMRAVFDSELDPRLLVEPVRDSTGAVVDLIYADVNRTALDLFGLSKDQLIGSSMLRSYPNMRETGLFDAYVEVLETGEPFVRDDSKVPSQFRPGRVPVDLRAVRIGDTLSISWRDLSDRYEAQAAVAASEARYRLLAENITDVVLTGDAAGVITWISEAAGERLGVSALTGQPVVNVVHADDRSTIDEVMQEVLAGCQRNVRLRLSVPQLSWRWYDMVIKPVWQDGVVVSWVAGWRDAHAEQLAVEELATSRAQYQLVAENAAEVVMLTAPSGEVIWVSPSAHRLLGLTPDQVRHRAHWDRVHPDDIEVVNAAFAPLASGADGAEATARLRNSEGTYEYWSIEVRRTSSAPDAEVVETLRNIDVEVRARMEAQAQTARRVAALESMFDPHVLLRALRSPDGSEVIDFEFMDANVAALEAGGMSRQDIAGARVLEVVPDLRTSGIFERLVEVVRSGKPLVLDEFRYAGGLVDRPRRFDLRAVTVGDAVSLTWRDVTQRFRMRQLLAVSEERFRLMATNTSDIVGLTGMDGVLQWVSPALTRELGWQPERWIGQRIEHCVHPDDVSKVQAQMRAVIGGASSLVRMRVADSNGEYHWVESRAAPFQDDNGAITGLMAAMTTIDERVAQEALLRHQASHDHLTGLLTRDAAYRRVVETPQPDLGCENRAFLAFIDMDNLKQVNDTLGHGAGDEMLRIVARRICAVLPDSALVARVGGDEVLVVMPGIEDRQKVLSQIRRLMEVVVAPHPYGEHTLYPRMSVGLAALGADEDLESAVGRADAAMYRAKAAGGNTVVWADDRNR